MTQQLWPLAIGELRRQAGSGGKQTPSFPSKAAVLGEW